MICSYCDRDFKALFNHQKYCVLNPSRKSLAGKNNPHYGKSGGNQFTVAASEGRVIHVSKETRQKISNSGRNKVWSEERRLKHSMSMRRAVEKYPDSYSVSNVSGRTKMYEFNGMKFKGTWELKVAQALSDTGIRYTNKIKPIEYIWNNKTHKYFPDFYLLDFDLYIEVKGYTRERDICKWKNLPNLIVIGKKQINSLNQFFSNLTE